MPVVRNLIVRGGADFSGMRKGMQQAQRQLGNFQQTVSRSMKKIAVTLASIGAGFTIGAAVKDAMKFEAMMGTLGQTLGQSINDFVKWQNTVGASLGFSKVQSADLANTLSLNFKMIATSQKDLFDKTTKMMETAAIISNKRGMAMSEVSDRIRSAMNQEADGADELGVNVRISAIQQSKAYKEMANGKPWSQLSTNMQKTILYHHILQSVSENLGDSLQNNTQMKMSAFTASLADARMALGQAFLPILNVVLPVLTAFVRKIESALIFIAQFSRALFGLGGSSNGAAQAKATDQQAKAVTGLGNATEKAGKQAKKAAKDAQGSIASFDELNQLADKKPAADSGDSGTDASAGAMGIGLDTSGFENSTNKVSEKAQELANKVNSIFGSIGDVAKSIGSKIRDAYSGMGPALQPIIGMREQIISAFKEIGNTVTEFYQNALKPMASYILSDFIPSIAIGFMKSFAPVFAEVVVWAIQEFSRTFKNATEEISKLWNGTWLPSLEKIKSAYLEYFPQIAGAIQTVLNGTIKPFVDYFLNGFVIPIASKINQVLVPILTDVLVWAMKEVGKTFKWAADLMNDIYATVIRPVFDLLKKIVMDTLSIVQGLWEKHGATLLKNLSGLMNSIRTIFQKLWDDVLKPIIEPFLNMLSELWDKHLKGLVAQVGDFVMKVVNGALEIWNKFISPLVSWLLDTLKPSFTTTFSILASVVGNLVGGIVDAAKGIFKSLGGVVDFIVGVFTGDWKKAWEGVKDIFKGIFDSLYGIVKAPLNLIIDAINWIISGINSFKIDVPDWVAKLAGMEKGGSFGIHIDPIKHLAKGGITNGPMMAVIGDNPGGREVVSPLSDLQDIVASAVGTAVMQAMQYSNRPPTNEGDIVINIDGMPLVRILNPLLEKEQNRTGAALIKTI